MKSISQVGHLIRKDWLMFNQSQKHPVAEAWGSSRCRGLTVLVAVQVLRAAHALVLAGAQAGVQVLVS